MNQPNSPLPGAGVAITLDRPRVLRLPFNSLCALGKATGDNPLNPEFWQRFDDPERLRATLWASLIHEDPTLTIEQAGDLIAVDRVPEIANALATAITQAMPAAKPEAKAA